MQMRTFLLVLALVFCLLAGSCLSQAEGEPPVPVFTARVVPDGFTPLDTPLGDCNCDGVVDFADVDSFIDALADMDKYRAQVSPDCVRMQNWDCWQDGVADFRDIDAFIAILYGPADRS